MCSPIHKAIAGASGEAFGDPNLSRLAVTHRQTERCNECLGVWMAAKCVRSWVMRKSTMAALGLGQWYALPDSGLQQMSGAALSV